MMRLFSIFGLVLLPQMLFAHIISVDGDISDWDGTPPAEDNSAVVSEGEWVWKDAAEDQRSDNPSVDITEFRVTADTENLYFLIKFRELALGTTDITYPLVQVAIDYAPDRGASVFRDIEGQFPTVNKDAYWERLVQIFQRTPSSNTCHIEDEGSLMFFVAFDTHSYYGGKYSHALSTNGFIEARVPFGVASSGVGKKEEYLNSTVRFTVAASMHLAAFGGGWGGIAEFESGKCNIMDCISIADDTEEEIADNIVDFYFDVDFDSDGDVVLKQSPSIDEKSLKVDGKEEIRIAEGYHPIFSWEFDGQVACQVLLGDWNSGVRFTAEQSLRYEGAPLTADTEYSWKVRVMDRHGVWSDWTIGKFTTIPSAATIDENETNLAIDWNNPFDPKKEEYTIIGYLVPEDAYVDIYIYDISGKLVRKLIEDKDAKAGQFYTEPWDGTDDDDQIVGRGIYLVNLRAGKVSKVKRVIVE